MRRETDWEHAARGPRVCEEPVGGSTISIAHRLLTEHHKLKNGTTIFEHRYGYDLAGNRQTKTFEEVADPGTDPILHYDYDGDGLNQLVNVGSHEGDTNGSRTDLVGTAGGEDNLASVVVTNTTRTEDTPAQVRGTFYIARGIMLDMGTNELQVVAEDKSGNTTTVPSGDTHDIDLDNTLDLDYDYDDAGCLEYVKDGVSGAYLTKYVYDDEHRLIEVIDDPDVPGQQDGDNYTVVTFVYDALGRRIQKEIYVDGSLDETVRYIYSGLSVIEEYVDDSGWILEAEYVHGIGIDNVLTIERDSTTWYYHHDGLGSVTELLDANGDLVQAYEYDAWGNVTIYNPDDTTILNPYMYTGRRWDPEISLYYYRARYYDPKHGRFTQPDPIGYVSSVHLYGYAAQNPLLWSDPFGLANYRIGADHPKITYEKGAGTYGSLHSAVKHTLAPIRSLAMTAADVLIRLKRVPHAAEMLAHYLDNSGTAYDIELESMLADSIAAQALYDQELRMAMRFVESLDPGTYEITSGTAIKDNILETDSVDWFLAIGTYSGYGKGTAKVMPQDRGIRQYCLAFHYYVKDKYNWDAKKKASLFGVPLPSHRFMGQFHLAGLAKEYFVDGTVGRRYYWYRGAAKPEPVDSGQQVQAPGCAGCVGGQAVSDWR